ncbi:hypothetical protein [Pseudorhodoplanes sp.]|uniref:hypothetical protein n=1 Tax=Pseudorhodoplanes sp. TaxID=1934341 RepID=UPI00391B6A58
MTVATAAKSLLRTAIVAAAALQLWSFSELYRNAFVAFTGGEAQWLLDGWQAFAAGIAAPTCALAAAALAIADRKLTPACLLVTAALVLHVSFVFPFVLAVLIHGA